MFGLALILMMRFRPEGLVPSARVRQELHPGAAAGPVNPVTLANTTGEVRALGRRPAAGGEGGRA